MKRYTSDLHVNHKNILKYDKRPFDTIVEHDVWIIDRINEFVKDDDELYILWDIGWRWDHAISHLKNIRCKNIFFCVWNHDFSKYVKMYEEELWWTNLGNMHIDKQSKVVLCHYPMDERYHSNHMPPDNFIHIHWHSHGNSKKRKNRIDVWLTFNHLDRPLNLEEIRLFILLQDKNEQQAKKLYGKTTNRYSRVLSRIRKKRE